MVLVAVSMCCSAPVADTGICFVASGPCRSGRYSRWKGADAENDLSGLCLSAIDLHGFVRCIIHDVVIIIEIPQ